MFSTLGSPATLSYNCASAGHVGGNRNAPRFARGRDDSRLFAVVQSLKSRKLTPLSYRRFARLSLAKRLRVPTRIGRPVA
jgi:hypothetical protein